MFCADIKPSVYGLILNPISAYTTKMKKQKKFAAVIFFSMFCLTFSGCKPEIPTDPDVVVTETPASEDPGIEKPSDTNLSIGDDVVTVDEVSPPTVPTLPNNPIVFKLTCEEARFVSLINIYRSNNLLPTLRVSISGVKSTHWHAQDMITKNYFAHSEPDGRSFSERAKSFGYPTWSENIAAGNTSASATFCQWKNSPGHNTNMLREQHTTMGIGNITGGGIYRSYWSNNFAGVVSDLISMPSTKEANCTLPLSLPAC